MEEDKSSMPPAPAPAAPAPVPAPQPMAPAPVQQGSGGSGFGVAALVLGILGFLIGFIPFMGTLPGILAVVFGIVGLKREGRGMAVTGLILGGLTLLGVIFWVIMLIIGASMPDSGFDY